MDSGESLDILDTWQEPDGTHVARINGLGTEFRAPTRDEALEAAADELSQLQETAEGRELMARHGLFERYAYVRGKYAQVHAHVGAQTPATEPLTEAGFEALMASGAPFVVDFWATWCQPCKSFAPIFESVADEMRDELQFRAADLEAEASLAERLEVLAVPTIIGFAGGVERYRTVGALRRTELIDSLRTHVLGQP